MRDTHARQSGQTMVARRALRIIAGFEALKGLAALAAAIGLLDLLHHDLRHLALLLIGRFGLHPEGHFALMLLHDADWLQHANLHLLALLVPAYIALRLTEAYGLWMGCAWGEWLAALSGGLYIPFEVSHLLSHFSWLALAVLGSNTAVVLFLVLRLRQQRTG
jgi:uncharacterized membrane protein (DUF2068 family)